MDIAEGQGKKIDAAKIEKRLGIPVVPFVAADRKDYDAFYKAVDRALEQGTSLNTKDLDARYREMEGGYYRDIYALIPDGAVEGYSSMWLAAKGIEGDTVVAAKVREALSDRERSEMDGILARVKNGALFTGDCKFKWIDEIQDAVSGKNQSAALSKFDKKATSKRT